MDTDRLPGIIGDAVKPFGFTGGERAYEGMSFYSLGGRTFTSNERIDVIWDAKSRQINIIDYNKSSESALIKNLVESITNGIKANSASTITFRPRQNQWTECLGP